MNYDTQAEALFADICERLGYSLKLLVMHADEKRRSADYEVNAPGCRFVVGIEELNNPDFAPRRGDADFAEWTVGAQARKALRMVSAQLRGYRERGWPLLVVLYDNSGGTRLRSQSCVEAPQIDAAMYGDDAALRKIGTRGVEPDWMGEDRTLTATDRTHISAVGVISAWENRTLLLFHNVFARTPFPGRAFNDSFCHHFEKQGKPYSENWKWRKLVYLAD
jgi:hypothetical protein